MSAQQQQQSSSHKNVCVITNGDSLLGYALAYRFLEAMQNREEINGAHKLRILVREKHNIGLKKLEDMGGEIHEINYKDEEKVRHCLKDVRNVILIPEHSSDCLKEAQHLIKAAKHQDVDHFAMMSYIGVDRIHKNDDGSNNDQQQANFSEFRNFKEYHEIEKCVKESFKDKYCIVRHAPFNQLLYFLAPQIEGENVLPLPVKKNAKWNSVNLNDVVEGIYRLAKKQHEQNATHKRIYEFTLQRSMNAEEMAREIGEGLGRQDLRFEQISEQDFRKQLERMKDDKRFRERPDAHGKFGEGRDGWWSFPLGKFINGQMIECMLEYFRLANKGQLDITSDDLKHLLDRKPQDLKEYFKVNRDQFKRFK